MPVSRAYRPDPRLPGLGPEFADPVAAADFPQTLLRFRNDRAAATVGLDALTDAEWVAHFGRFQPLPGNIETPLAQRYHGHQFRVYNPDLGDGRGFTFAQLREVGSDRLLDLAADRGLDGEFAAWLNAETDPVLHGAGHPAVRRDPRDRGEAHAGRRPDDLQDARHRFQAGDQRRVVRQHVGHRSIPHLRTIRLGLYLGRGVFARMHVFGSTDHSTTARVERVRHREEARWRSR